jgi:hypothetical protein
MIVAIGVDVDETFAGFVDRALDAGVELQVLNLRAAVEGEWRFDVPVHGAARLHYGDVSTKLLPENAFYCRIIDLSSPARDQASAQRWQALIGGLQTWLDFVPGRVVNRWRGGSHNGSKPLHETVLRELGFRVPESITSSEVDELQRFVREGDTISKPVCGVRADAILVTEADFEEFEPFGGPVHLQRFVRGADARIHVVGDRLVAQRVSGGNVDYRRAGDIDEMEVFDPPPALRDLLVEGTRAIGLEFAGWDFKIDDDDVYWCLEANPMPGYSPYDTRCDGAISRELLLHLESGGPVQ